MYLYNGKELQKDFGLDWYCLSRIYFGNYGARFYDAQLGRFTGIDAPADTFVWVTPYNYAENSPIANVDLWGLQAVPFQGVMATFDKKGYSRMVDQRNKAAENIDYVGVSVSANGFIGGGGSGDINLAYVKGDGVFISADGKTGPGVDISFGITITIGHYSGEGKPTGESTKGPSIFENAGVFGVTVGASQDLSKSSKGEIVIGDNWNFTSVGYSIGSKTVTAGSTGVSDNTPPLIYLYKETQETENKAVEKNNEEGIY